MVEEGQLDPPVDARLPKNPLVVQVLDQIGVYFIESGYLQ